MELEPAQDPNPKFHSMSTQTHCSTKTVRIQVVPKTRCKGKLSGPVKHAQYPVPNINMHAHVRFNIFNIQNRKFVSRQNVKMLECSVISFSSIGGGCKCTV